MPRGMMLGNPVHRRPRSTQQGHGECSVVGLVGAGLSRGLGLFQGASAVGRMLRFQHCCSLALHPSPSVRGHQVLPPWTLVNFK